MRWPFTNRTASYSINVHLCCFLIPQANNLIKAGYDVTVWNRSPDRCAPLVAAGAKAGASPKAVAAACDITFAMLADPAAALAVATGPDGIAAGARIIDARFWAAIVRLCAPAHVWCCEMMPAAVSI